MQQVGDLRFRADSGETVTFAEQSRVAVVTVVADALSLPQTRTAGQTIDITVGFSGTAGGKLVVLVTGSNGGAVSVDVNQLGAMPSRSLLFTVV